MVAGTPAAVPEYAPKLLVMSLRATPDSMRTLGPLLPSPGYGPAISCGGTGATFDTAVHLGPTTLRLRVEVTDWLDNSTVTLRAVKGIEGTIRWDFAAVDESTTRITATVDYRVPGGLAGRALDRIIQAFVGPAIRHTEKHLREHLDRAYAESTAGNA